MTYVIRRNDGMYVAKPGSRSSYTNRLQNAQTFTSKEAAESNMCPGNEHVEPAFGGVQ